MANLKLAAEINIVLEDPAKEAFLKILHKSQEIDGTINTGRLVMTDEFLKAMETTQINLNTSAVDIAKMKLDWDGDENSKTPKQDDEQRRVLEKTIQTGKAPQAIFSQKGLTTVAYTAVAWPSDVKKTNDKVFCQTVARASQSAVAIWNNPDEFYMDRTIDGKLQPMRAAYLQHDGGKNPGKMVGPDKSLITAKDNPDMYDHVPAVDDDGKPVFEMVDGKQKLDANGKPVRKVDLFPFFENASWSNLQAEYRKQHPSEYKGSSVKSKQEKAFIALATDGDVSDEVKQSVISDTQRVAMFKTLCITLGSDTSKAIDRPDIDNLTEQLIDARNTATETLKKLTRALADAEGDIIDEEKADNVQEALETAKNI